MRTTEIDIKSNGELGQIDINRYMPECYIIVLRDNSSDRIYRTETHRHRQEKTARMQRADKQNRRRVGLPFDEFVLPVI